ncbi:6-phosphogluconate dehydrogenase C-terminal domain-like protein [Massarina eburnea CBS 473.64]|uniref:6-phosphogluconate dehydrogenase C-terminal domain-like protein n=1 Tax=Massarina eburnea CBS 473.64 TaxID=1395130 RepID=A0A6A6RZI2_9PLEO|nr:6-phosphogluconate dehydrogenase C-terminal domain-like protein [Massarina eburnea CBS 473.64]
MADTKKKSVLVIGGGSVGTIAALNLEVGGLAEVTLVLRSNYEVVKEKGFTIESIDHGALEGWRPSHIRNTVPDILKESLPPYDYIVIATKNIPDIPPTAVDLVAPALGHANTHTTLVLVQNGLNIEVPFLQRWPRVTVLSGVSLIGSAETEKGKIVQDDRDRLLIGAFGRGGEEDDVGEGEKDKKAETFVTIYSAGGKTDCVHSTNVLHDRWRKLVYNACLNPICAVTGLDTGRIRLVEQGEVLEGLVRPAMREIVEAAGVVADVKLDGGVVEFMIGVDPLELFLKPSMLADVEKGNFIEFENLLGEPLREGKKAGVPMPTLEVLYQIARAVQWRTKEARGLVAVPAKRTA